MVRCGRKCPEFLCVVCRVAGHEFLRRQPARASNVILAQAFCSQTPHASRSYLSI
jgi:hypothetical protein